MDKYSSNTVIMRFYTLLSFMKQIEQINISPILYLTVFHKSSFFYLTFYEIGAIILL